MSTLIFDPKDHFSPADQKRLADRAAALGITPDELIEVVMKRELFSSPSTARKRKGGRR